MSRPLIIRCRLRAYILDRCKHWHLDRQRVPRAVIDTIADDLAKQIDVRICAMLTKTDPTPKPPKPRTRAPIRARSLKNQPTLL